ncbi:MAG: NUDIX hydrolase [Candidatus Saccharimonadales bacterium]
MSRRITARGIIFKDGKLFCVRLNGYRVPGGAATDYLCTPGGGLDDGEGLIKAIEREIVEETGIRPDVGNLLYIQQYPDGEDNEHLELFYHVTNANDYETVDLTQTTHGVEEIAEFGFVDPKTTHVLPKFLTETNIAEDIKAARTQTFTYL